MTDTYPPFPRFDTETGQCAFPDRGGVLPPGQLNPRIDAQLSALIYRMLSPHPEERGSAGELTEAMKRGVAHAEPSADGPLFEWETLPPAQWTEAERADAGYLGHRPRYRGREQALVAAQADAAERAQAGPRKAEACGPQVRASRQVKPRGWLAWLAAVLALGLWPGQTGSLRTELQPTVAQSTSGKAPEAVSLGEAAQSPAAVSAMPSDREGITEELPEQPVPGQLKPDAKGRCPNRQIVINGGCWAKVDFDLKDCPGIGYVYQGGCYVAGRATMKVPTSSPQER